MWVGRKVSIRSLVELIVEKSGKNLSIEHDLTQPTIKTSLYLNCSLAQEELGWTPMIELEEGVEKQSIGGGKTSIENFEN